MFAGAAREVVFSNPDVVRQIKQNFIPVALKAGLVNDPPGGVEGDLYAEIKRTSPAPQGICVVNSAGQVLVWALSFRNDESIVEFLRFATRMYRENPRGDSRVAARRFMKFPGRELAAVEDVGRRPIIPGRHTSGDLCPARPTLPPGTLLGQVIGRPLDENGEPVADTIRQENYTEARFQISTNLQQQLAEAVDQRNGKRFRLPNDVARHLVAQAYLGQLDVNPLGGVPGSRNDSQWWQFHGQQVESREEELIVIRITGRSHIEGGQLPRNDTQRNDTLGDRDGRMWEHAVSLDWQGYVSFKGHQIVSLDMVAQGRERLQWGNSRPQLFAEVDAAHLMAGHPIDLDCTVRYTLTAN